MTSQVVHPLQDRQTADESSERHPVRVMRTGPSEDRPGAGEKLVIQPTSSSNRGWSNNGDLLQGAAVVTLSAMNSDTSASRPGLVRALGPLMAVAVVVGTVIGSGIF